MYYQTNDLENKAKDLTDNLSSKWNVVTDVIRDAIPKVAFAIIIFILGIIIIKLIRNVFSKLMKKSKMSETLQRFLGDLLNWTLKVLLFIMVVEELGVPTSSFIAILGTAGLAVGLALKGSLANFAGGVMLMIFKPFKVGEVIEAQGHIGKVKEIQIFVTKLLTPDNKLVIIPNGALSNGNIVNYSAEGTRRIDFTFGISYDADIKQAKDILLNIVNSNDKVLKDTETEALVNELADNSVNIIVRCWVNGGDYFPVYFDTMEKAKYALDKAGIGIPYPQRDIHVYNHEA
ncbi:mechanosensitive ion channel family protein [Aureivirga marina]|uniref:mechanosensitive ion channel family protein n=1 Tax=Aureivirga marina TaxID=1182451 RepID=UPI0018C92903|nr:mechanosensitive ion channel domain-containing protein [Aureivirga marina]